MRIDDGLLRHVRMADPLDADAVDAWWEDGAARRIVDRVCAEPVDLPRVTRGRLVPLAAAVLLASAATAGVAVANGLLGGPAPHPVQEHLAELERGMPTDLRYDPDLAHARAVAASGAAVLYLADLADGGYCMEIASESDRPRGASCTPAARRAGLPLDVLAPIPDGDGDALVLGGRANSDSIQTVEVRYADGVVAPVDLGLDRAWILTVPAAERASVLISGVVVAGLDRAGATVTAVPVPPLHDDDPDGTAHDADRPLVLGTVSDGSNLSRVVGIQGRVNLAGPVRLEVRFPDGSRLAVPVATDGAFRLTFSPDRQDDFARRPGSLVVLRDDAVLASTPIYSVAAWRATHD
jgi:hypothetical protein